MSETPTVLTTLPEIKEVTDVEVSRGFSQKEKSPVFFTLNRSQLSDKSVTKLPVGSLSKGDDHSYQNILPVTSVSKDSFSLNFFEIDDVTKVYSHDVFCAPVERGSSINSEVGRVSLFSSYSAEVSGSKKRKKTISFLLPNNCGEYEEINVFVETKPHGTIRKNK